MLLQAFVALCALALTGGFVDGNPCEELNTCTDILNNLNSLEGLQPFTDMNPTEVLTIVCNEVNASHTCVDNVEGVCRRRSRVGQTRAILEIGDHICDPENADDMEELFNSDCFTNETAGDRFGSEMESCAMDFVRAVKEVAMAQYRNRHITRRPDPTAYCPHFSDLETCMVRVATEECGEIAGELTSTIWDIAVRHSMPNELSACFTDVQASRRALEYMMPSLAKRHLQSLDWVLGDWD